MSDTEWMGAMARVQAAYGTRGEVGRVIRQLLAIYRQVPVRLERRLRARALTEDRPLAELVVEALGRYLDEPPVDDDAPASEAGAGKTTPCRG